MGGSTGSAQRHRAPSRSPQIRLWMVVLVGVLIVGVPFTRVSPDSAASFLWYDSYLAGCAVALCWAGLHQRESRALWFLASAAMVAYVCGDLAWYLVLWTTGEAPSSASAADIGYLAYYPLMAGCLLVLLRRRRRVRDWATVLDGLIITTGLGLSIWILLALPSLADGGSLTGRAIAVAYPLMDIVLLSVAVRLAVTAGRRPVSYYLLAGGILTMLIADVIAGQQMIAGVYLGGGWLDVAALGAQGLIAAAALHPSASELVRPPAARTGGSSKVRLAGLCTAALIGPLLAAVAPGTPQRLLALAATGVMFVLILARLEVLSSSVRLAEARFRSLVTNASDGIIVVDRRGQVAYASPSTRPILEVGAPGRFGATVHPDDLLIVDSAMDRVRDAPQGTAVAFTARVLHRDGGWRYVEAIAGNQLPDRSVAGVVVNLRDVTERAELEAQLRDQALHDPVTGLANRSLFLDRAGQALACLDPGNGVLAVLAIDLDDFAEVDDELGHRLGDEVLRALGERLAGCIQPGDTVARLGGDTFAVLLPQVADRARVVTVAQGVIEEIRRRVLVGERQAMVTACIGIAFAQEGQPVGALLRNATVAMHTARMGGPSRLSVFDPQLVAGATARLRLVADL